MSRKLFISNNLAKIHAFYDLESTSLLLGVRKRIEDNELPKTRFACARAVVILIERAKFTHSAMRTDQVLLSPCRDIFILGSGRSRCRRFVECAESMFEGPSAAMQ